MLLKTGSGEPIVYTTVAGLRLHRLTLNAETVDITNMDSSGEWRELLAGTGVKSATIAGSGVFKDAATDATVRSAAFDQTALSWQATIPDFGTITGPFIVTQLEYAGEYKGEVTFSLTLASAGALTFAAI